MRSGNLMLWIFFTTKTHEEKKQHKENTKE